MHTIKITGIGIVHPWIALPGAIPQFVRKRNKEKNVVFAAQEHQEELPGLFTLLKLRLEFVKSLHHLSLADLVENDILKRLCSSHNLSTFPQI